MLNFFIYTLKIHSNVSINCLSTKKKVGINPKTLIDFSQTIDDVYENLEDYSPTKNGKLLIMFDDMIADMEANNKLSPMVTELFIRGTKVNNSFVFTSQSYFKVHKDMTLNVTRNFFMKILNKRELRQIASNDSCDIKFIDFMEL